jgi:hypothetical protein
VTCDRSVVLSGYSGFLLLERERDRQRDLYCLVLNYYLVFSLYYFVFFCIIHDAIVFIYVEPLAVCNPHEINKELN